jgi:Ca-activated chloride channel homolog
VGICSRIAHELRNQYTLGYSPKNTKNDGSWRSIRVTVTAGQVAGKPVVRAKQGYVATADF